MNHSLLILNIATLILIKRPSALLCHESGYVTAVKLRLLIAVVEAVALGGPAVCVYTCGEEGKEEGFREAEGEMYFWLI